MISWILSNLLYEEAKRRISTFIASAIALESLLEQIKEMHQKLTFRYLLVADIIEFFIRQGHYNIHETNEALFPFSQGLLENGAV